MNTDYRFNSPFIFPAWKQVYQILQTDLSLISVAIFAGQRSGKCTFLATLINEIGIYLELMRPLTNTDPYNCYILFTRVSEENILDEVFTKIAEGQYRHPSGMTLVDSTKHIPENGLLLTSIHFEWSWQKKVSKDEKMESELYNAYIDLPYHHVTGLPLPKFLTATSIHNSQFLHKTCSLVLNLPTSTLNPSLTKDNPHIKEMYEIDPVRTARDFDNKI